MVKAMRLFLKELKLPLRAEFVLPDEAAGAAEAAGADGAEDAEAGRARGAEAAPAGAAGADGAGAAEAAPAGATPADGAEAAPAGATPADGAGEEKSGRKEKAIAQLRAVFKKLVAQAKTAIAAHPQVREGLLATLKEIDANLQAGEPAAARDGIIEAGALLKGLAGRAATAAEAAPADGAGDAGAAPAEAASAETAPAGDAAGADGAGDAGDAGAQAKWEAAFARLEPAVNKALKERLVEDVSKLRVRWSYAVEQANDGAYEKALATVPGIAKMLREGAAAPRTEVPKDVVAFQKSRIMWIDTKRQMMDEMIKLQDAIVAQSADDEDAAEIKVAGESLLANVEEIDDRLEKILEQITVTEEGDKRTGLKRQAADAIKNYNALLDTPFFKAIDDNPFVQVSVTAKARESLGSIGRTLG
jgi:hypothetical protein